MKFYFVDEEIKKYIVNKIETYWLDKVQLPVNLKSKLDITTRTFI